MNLFRLPGLARPDPFQISTGSARVVVGAPHHGTRPEVDADLGSGPVALALADRLAGRWFASPPNLAAFRGLQHSRAKLAAGIAAAWLLGGLLEELVARGIVLQSVEAGLTGWLGTPAAAVVAICVAAAGAGLVHSYQGPRAVVITAQLSVLLGILFVASGRNLWAVILCHGLYDTIAFIRFANRQSRYSHFDQGQLN